ncbi:sensor histidine kinase [Aurantiacibacter gangjinensis]|uniref:histidine kinase n=1 Tax=Aurantiacibacter gangjinensis TaxID=502682 RepID=A0A0G9MR37_9SPHN|nr:histidine kinase dimerization/phospho-acceptor domain-containing protein [Aurantiacibacter gangjinensis]APE29081.1 hypothetical protein BMF35_a2252 [Aurantiacibacter gangjinensis]KLE33172.1 hypothetical protein AAW01_04135 [Aurantiacibacter gangjinensis]
MQFDDRLATVMRMRTDSDAALRTQFRQLVDILGTSPAPQDDAEAGAVEQLLDGVFSRIPAEEQSAILRKPGVRLRNPDFVAYLAGREPKLAAAAMATARLTDEQWLALIPALPVTARGFLRHRRDLSPQVKRLLERLGVGDLVLPSGDVPKEAPAALAPEPSPLPETESGIGALRRRIQAFQERRPQGGVAAPRLPLNDAPLVSETMLDVVTDASGVVVQTDSVASPALVGLRLASPVPGQLVEHSEATLAALRLRQPVRHAAVTITAAPEISGEWRMAATPLFDRATGGFTGYAARLRRPNIDADDMSDHPGDAMRQVLHELRTPVNAIQGFAEIIQQQLFGNVPHEYRAHAAAIAVDAAKLLAGFDEVDRLVKLESGAAQLDEGVTDFREALVETMRRLEGVLRPRGAGFRLDVPGSPFHVAMSREEAMVICWRLLATAAGSLGPGEQAALTLRGEDGELNLMLDVPQALRGETARTARKNERRKAVSAGMFGPSFAFRLAEAEADAAGGSLDCDGDRVTLRLPSLTAPDEAHSTDGQATGS